MLPGHFELEVHVDLTGGNEGVDPGLLRMLYSLPSLVYVSLIASGEAAYDGHVIALPTADLLRNQSDSLQVCLGGSGKSGLNDVDAKPGELAGYGELLLGGHGGSRGLLAVAESGVENAHIVRIGDPVRDVFRAARPRRRLAADGGGGERLKGGPP